MYRISKSEIHGDGVFITKDLVKGETIGVVVEDTTSLILYITKDFGVYVNHSDEPNAKLFIEGNKLLLKSIRDIKKGEEILGDYNDPENPWYINKM